ncbi:hypothetical protein [Paenibacillus sp. HJGM_3]|uniref:hypothetical protein n=1 Tax=Paenibacillus sp. HJGM_3 TaxID=3379816 RepID=UPI00385F8CEF
MIRELYSSEFIEDVIKHIRIHGYYSVLFNEDFTDLDALYFLESLKDTFANIVYVNFDDTKKYFVINEPGKKTVLKLMEKSIHLTKRGIYDSLGNVFPEIKLKFDKMTRNKKALEQVRFY